MSALSVFDKIAEVKAEFKKKIKARDITGFKTDKHENVSIKKIKLGKDSTLNLTVIINPKAKVTPYIKKLGGDLSKLYESGSYFCRKDLLEPISDNQLPSKKYEHILTKMKPHLTKCRSKDIGALRYSMTICRLEDNKKDQSKIELYRKKIYNLYSSNRGYVIYNWLRCIDNIFEEEIFPYMNTCLTLAKNTEHFEKIFLPFWDGMIFYHPRKIFVSSWMATRELKYELDRRLYYNREREVKVYTRASRNKFVGKIIPDYIKNKKFKKQKFQIKTKDYKLGNTDAKTFIITRK
ncbi:MAG: hypothetical protein KAT37_01915 [Candidatus Aenigmarchaeota archaeon]|nr:hypothetical protein [Candidatus Aenigmarchaeota archaeon]